MVKQKRSSIRLCKGLAGWAALASGFATVLHNCKLRYTDNIIRRGTASRGKAPDKWRSGEPPPGILILLPLLVPISTNIRRSAEPGDYHAAINSPQIIVCCIKSFYTDRQSPGRRNIKFKLQLSHDLRQKWREHKDRRSMAPLADAAL